MKKKLNKSTVQPIKSGRSLFRPEPKNRGFLAIEENSLDFFFDMGAERETVVQDEIAIIDICGPLEHHASFEWDSYDAITDRLQKAFEDSAVKAIVIRFDSPGGDAAGATEAHRKILALKKRYGKYLCAYVDEMMCSAAYELGSACDEIWMPETAVVGSIGVIATVVDQTQANDMQGVVVRLITTGKRKGDGDSNKPLTDDVEKALKKRVDFLGNVFFDIVSKARGLPIEHIQSLQAGVFSGIEAVEVGLATGIAGWDEFYGNLRAAIAGQSITKRDNVSNRSLKNNMRTLLQAISTRDAAKAAIASAKTDKERDLALYAYEAAVGEVVSLQAGAKKTTYRHEVEEESTEEAADDDGDDDEDGGEADDAEAVDAASDDEDEEPKESAAADDDEEEDKKASSKALSAKVAAELFALCKKVTGKSDPSEVLGSLEALGDRLKSNDKTAQDVAKLKRDALSAKVEGMLKAAAKDGRVTPAQVKALKAQGVKDPKWLRGYLSTLPKSVRSTDEAFYPNQDESGNISLDNQGLTQDQKKIIETAAHHSGRSFNDQLSDISSRLRAKTNPPRV